MKWLAIWPALLTAGAVSSALAAAPEPRKPFDVGHMTGRWYEIARTPNSINRDCQAGTTDWVPAPDGTFKVTVVCRKGALDGPAQVVKAAVAITDPVTHAKVRMSVLGGLIAQDYWLLDHAGDYAWLIMGTPGGKFISIMASRPHLPPAAQAEAILDARALGYDTSRLVFPIQPGGS